MNAPTFDHLAAAVPLPDAAFDEFWEHYLRARPDLVDGATLELEREQLRMLQKIAFIAGREAALREVQLIKQS
jgi:hypothetical protein